MGLSAALIRRIVQTRPETGRLAIQPVRHFLVGFNKLIMLHEPLINGFSIDHFAETRGISMTCKAPSAQENSGGLVAFSSV